MARPRLIRGGAQVKPQLAGEEASPLPALFPMHVRSSAWLHQLLPAPRGAGGIQSLPLPAAFRKFPSWARPFWLLRG